MDRRTFLAGLSAVLAGPSIALGASDHPRLVVVVLRGGLDGLAMLPATGDPAFEGARGSALGEEAPLPLDDLFSLHPAMAALMPLWERKQLLFAHGVGLPDAHRSHFDAQDVLESGLATSMRSDSGWLNRALVAANADRPAMAVGAHVPLLLRGQAAATSVDLAYRARREDPRMAGVRRMMAHDPMLGPAMEQGLQTRALVDSLGGRRGKSLDHQAAVLARLMGRVDGPRVAVFDVGGFDTHTRQEQTLSKELGQLAEGLVAYAEGYPEGWSETTIVCVSEFGRTVAGNGTGGTDHGVGGAMLLAGGAVRGGRVLHDWPGLASGQLLEGRDLRPTLDVRGVLKGALQGPLGLDARVLGREVFPGSKNVAVVECV